MPEFKNKEDYEKWKAERLAKNQKNSIAHQDVSMHQGLNLQAIKLHEHMLRIFPLSLAKKYNAFPIKRSGQTLTVAIERLYDNKALDLIIDNITFDTGFIIETAYADKTEITDAINRCYLIAGTDNESEQTATCYRDASERTGEVSQKRSQHQTTVTSNKGAIHTDKKMTLLNTILSGNTKRAISLIRSGTDVNTSDKHGISVLIHAISVGNDEIALLLIENGADVNVSDKNKTSAVILAASKGLEAIVTALLVKGACIEDSERVKLLLEVNTHKKMQAETTNVPENRVSTMRSISNNTAPQCPRCGSFDVTIREKGFSVGKAAVGLMVPFVGVAGALAGFHGSGKVQYVCMNCKLTGAAR